MTNKKDEALVLTYDQETCEIKLNGILIATWNDEASHDYPEDLIWGRDISGLVKKCVLAGRRSRDAEVAAFAEFAYKFDDYTVHSRYNCVEPFLKCDCGLTKLREVFREALKSIEQESTK